MKKNLLNLSLLFWITCSAFILSGCEQESLSNKRDTIDSVEVENLTFDKNEYSMRVGDEMQLGEQIHPTNIVEKTLLWISSQPEVASISQDGLLTAIADGETLITAKSEDKIAVCTVTVSRKPGIYSAEDLLEFAYQWNNEGFSWSSIKGEAANEALSKEIKDAKDAVLSRWSSDGTPEGTILFYADIDMANLKYDPIDSNYGNMFWGNVDGQGHTINNLTINEPDKEYIGLFTRQGQHSVISNITLKNTRITARQSVGGIVGCSWGKVLACKMIDGKLVANDLNVGGIVGESKGKENQFYSNISDCELIGTEISGGKQYVGGIVGSSMYGEIIRCSTKGGTISGSESVAGVAGITLFGKIIDCHVSDGLYVYSKGLYAGGIAPISRSELSGCTMRACTIECEYGQVGGIIGANNSDGTVKNCRVTNGKVLGRYNAWDDDVIGECYVGGIVGRNSSRIEDCTVDGNSDISGTGKNVGGITGESNGAVVENCVIYGNTLIQGDYTCVGGITGNCYDSQIHGCLMKGGSVSGTAMVGGIAGRLDATYGYGNSTITTSEIMGGTISGNSRVGGIVGFANSKILGCRMTGGTVTGNTEIGGIAGYNSKQIAACIITGGKVSGKLKVAGIAGEHNGSSAIMVSCIGAPQPYQIISESYIRIITAYTMNYSGTSIVSTFWSIDAGEDGWGNTKATGGGSFKESERKSFFANGSETMEEMNTKLEKYGWKWLAGSYDTNWYPVAEKK